MPMVDHYAGQALREMRELRGLSPEALSDDIRLRARNAAWGERGAVDAHTIRRIERRGHVPGPRVQFILASYFDKTVHELWVPSRSRAAA